ncbi:MAG: hypothetical protein AAB473_04160 [Patescibacteria group bacterium]
MWLKKVSLLILALFFALHLNFASAAMTSTNYQIQWDELSSGGGDASSSSYNIRDSTAGSAAGSRTTSLSYGIDQGFRAGVYDPVVDFVPYVQDRSTQVAATAFASNTVTVTTAAGFSVGDWIVIIQDEGASQVAAMGQISGISGSDITIRSSYSGNTPTIDGTNDLVYRMSPTASNALGTLSSSVVTTQIVGWVASADVSQGFGVYAFVDGLLQSESATLAGVVDGSVTAGNSEYGARSSDASLATSTFDTEDTAFSTEPVLVGSTSISSFNSSGFLTLKAAISATQNGGSYAQTLTTIFVGDY